MSMATVAAIAGTASAAMSIRSALRAGRDANSGAEDLANRADPFGPHREQYALDMRGRVNDLSSDPWQIARSPDFAFLRDQGLGAIGGTAAANNRFNSGGTGRDMARYVTGLGSQHIQQRFNNNMSIAQLYALLSGATSGNTGAASTNAGNWLSASRSAENTGWGNALGMVGRFADTYSRANPPAPPPTTGGENYTSPLTPPPGVWG